MKLIKFPNRVGIWKKFMKGVRARNDKVLNVMLVTLGLNVAVLLYILYVLNGI